MYVSFIGLRLTKTSLTLINRTRLRTKGQSAGMFPYNRFHIPEIFILQNLILRTRSCGTGFITQSSLYFHFQMTTSGHLEIIFTTYTANFLRIPRILLHLKQLSHHTNQHKRSKNLPFSRNLVTADRKRRGQGGVMWTKDHQRSDANHIGSI